MQFHLSKDLSGDMRGVIQIVSRSLNWANYWLCLQFDGLCLEIIRVCLVDEFLPLNMISYMQPLEPTHL